MAASFVQKAENSGSGSTSGVVMGAGPTEGNLLVAAVFVKNSETPTTSSGWTAGTAVSQMRMYYKVAGAGESTTQQPSESIVADWHAHICEYAPGAATWSLDVEGATNDASSPQDQAALNPTDSIDTIMVGAAGGEASLTYSGQTIGGSAATERTDTELLSMSLSMFDRLNVNTSTSTFAAQATGSATPSNGAIGLMIFKLTAAAAAGKNRYGGGFANGDRMNRFGWR